MLNKILWDAFGKFGNQFVSFVVSIILSRLLTPQEYGVMGMSLVVIGFAQGFLTLGLNSAIIQKKEVSELELSTVFYVNMTLAFTLTLICFLLAGYMAEFYNQPSIKPIFRTLSLLFIINGVGIVSSALLYRRMDFKTNSLLNLIAVGISGGVGIWMAYAGYGVWSLVAQQLLSSFLSTLFTLLYVRWWPSFVFQLHSIAALWKYSNKLLVSNILETLFARMDVLLIGKIFNASVLGYYTRAQAMDTMVKQISANSFLGALFPHIARNQHDKLYLKEIYLKYLHIIAFVAVGMSVALFIIVKSLFIVLFSERWLYSASLFKIMAVGSFLAPISALMLNMLTGLGASAAYLKLELQKKLILLPAYVIGLVLGIKGFIITMIIATAAGVILNAFFVSKQIAVSLQTQLWIVGKYLLAGIISATLAWFLSIYLVINSHLITILVYSAISIGLYILIVGIMKLQGLKVIPHLFNIIKLRLTSKPILQA